MSKIVVFGSLNMDLVIETPVIPRTGETVLGSGFMISPGGKGANQAVAAARLGGDVALVGLVGNDIFGKDLLTNLRRNRVNTDQVRTVNGVSTGVAMIVVKDGNNSIVVDPGANSLMTPEQVAQSEALIAGAAIVVLQLEIPLPAVSEAIRIAKKHQVRVVLNPAPAQPLSDDLLQMVDIFTPNELECATITGMAVNNPKDAAKAIGYLRTKGIPHVVVTMGNQGVVYNDGDRIIHRPVPEVKVVDTTAAGDSFNGALAVALAEGNKIHEAVDFGNLAGTLTVTKKGAQTSLPSLEDILKFEG